MAVVFEDDFNAYNNGDLNGQGSWTADVTWDVQGTTVFEGAKAIQNADSSGASLTGSKAGTLRADGRWTIYARLTATSGGAEHGWQIKEGGTLITKMRLDARNSAGNIVYLDSSGTMQVYGTFSANTWHRIEIEWRSSDKKFRMKVDAGAWTAWWAPYANFTSGIDTFMLDWWNNGAGIIGYFDYIAENPFRLSITQVETLAMAEIVSTPAKYILAKVESIALAEIISVKKFLSITITETISLVESATAKLIKAIISRVESITLNEIVSFKYFLKIAITETLALVESVSLVIKRFTVNISETLQLSEIVNLKARIWTFLTKHTADWTHKSKSASPTWTHKSKSTSPTWTFKDKSD